MNNSSTLQNSLMLAPLIGATDSLMKALGVWLIFIVVSSVFGMCMGALRDRLIPATHLLASVVLAATLTSCAEFGAQAWSLQWHQHLGVYAGLIALQCVVMDRSGFFQRTWRDRLRLCGLFGALLMVMGLLRELIGSSTLGSHLPWLAGATHPDWQGWVLTADGGLRLAILVPGGFILLGLLLAAWQAWAHPTPSH
ncbi:MAG TPA: NADH:quinone oxidoreductase [Pseudomonas sp.]|jgi:electron transport complex protein RnfE|nr:NADH:quinone oxidoreductase [Pseudomonas sp.]